MAPQVGGPSHVAQRLAAQRASLSHTQQTSLAAAPAEQRAFLEAQFKLQNEMELTDQLSRMLKTDDKLTIMRNL